MANDEFHKYALRYGKTDGVNIPLMPKDKYFAVGYNGRFGLLDVLEGNGEPVFEGRINIESLLSELSSKDKETVDSRVEDCIMKSYQNYRSHQSDPEGEYNPILEVLTDRT